MPFTFSHPAAVVPAKYLPPKYISVTALVVGSITPDFEYFIRMRNLSLYSHTWIGLFWFDIPLAFIISYVYHIVVKDALVDNLPVILKQRIARYAQLDWRKHIRENILIVLLSFAVGIATHIAWDGFTHRTGCFVAFIPWLKESELVNGVPITHYYILQSLSSAVGLIIVLNVIYKLHKDNIVIKKSIARYWITTITITLMIIIIRALIAEPASHLWQLTKHATHFNFYVTFFSHPTSIDFVMTAIGAFLASLILTSLLFKRLKQSR